MFAAESPQLMKLLPHQFEELIDLCALFDFQSPPVSRSIIEAVGNFNDFIYSLLFKLGKTIQWI